MSKNKVLSHKLQDAVGRIEAALADRGNVTSESLLRSLTLQSDGSHVEALVEQNRDMGALLSDIVNDIDAENVGTSGDSLAEATLQSAAVRAGLILTALAGNNKAIGEYNKVAHTNFASGKGAVTMQSVYSGLGGELDFLSSEDSSANYTQQSFDNNVLNQYIPRSILFNVLATRQDRFNEGWFPSFVMAPTEAGLSITVERQEVIPFQTRGATGAKYETPRRNLADAFIDHEILGRPATKLYPTVLANGENDPYLAAVTDIATKTIKVGDFEVSTRPLVLNKDINLLGVSADPTLLQNDVLNISDELGTGGGIGELYVQFSTQTDPQDPATLVKQFVSFDMSQAPRRQFKKSGEGKDREIALQFPTRALILDKNTVVHSGSVFPSMLQLIQDQDLVVQLKVNVTGLGSLQTANVQVNVSPLEVYEVRDSSGNELSLTEDGVGKDVVELLASLQAQVKYWYPDFRRSNSNWRTVGDLIDVSSYTNTIDIQQGYPLSVISATNEEQIGAKLAGMINANRARTSNSGLTTLINYIEHLAAQTEAMKRGMTVDIAGMSRFLIRPYYDLVDVDVVERVRNRRSGELVQDICWVLVDAIRDAAYHMFMRSNYGPVLEMITGSPDTKPTIIIGCDPIVERYLNIAGDTRLLGDKFDVQVVSSQDKRMRDKIYMSFSRKQPGHIDGCGFGTFGIIPEMMQKLTVDRDNTTMQQDRILPRQQHVPVLPCAVEFDITNLSEAVNGQI
jgi:hypothetical protein